MTASSEVRVPTGTRPPCVLVLLGFRRPFTNELTDGTTRKRRELHPVACLCSAAVVVGAGGVLVLAAPLGGGQEAADCGVGGVGPDEGGGGGDAAEVVGVVGEAVVFAGVVAAVADPFDHAVVGGAAEGDRVVVDVVVVGDVGAVGAGGAV